MLESVKRYVAGQCADHDLECFGDDHETLAELVEAGLFSGVKGFIEMEDGELLQKYVEMRASLSIDGKEERIPGVSAFWKIVDEAALIAYLTAEAVGERLAGEGES